MDKWFKSDINENSHSPSNPARGEKKKKGLYRNLSIMGKKNDITNFMLWLFFLYFYQLLIRKTNNLLEIVRGKYGTVLIKFI